MDIHHIDHFTLRVDPAQLPQLREFYMRVLQLSEGSRPAFDFPGHWLYANGRALVHLAGNAPVGEVRAPETLPTGQFNHVSLRTSGLKAARAHLEAQGVDWKEAPVPGMPLHQVFLHDPVGLMIELTFDASELESAGPSNQPVAY